MTEQDISYVVLEFAATFFGVLLAFGLTFWYDRRRKREQEESSRLKILQAVEFELGENLKHISPESIEDDTGDRTPILLETFSTAAFDSAVNSGQFTLLDVETQTELAKIYRDFQNAKMWQDKVLSMIGSADMAMTSAKTNLKEFQDWVFRTQEGLRKNIPKVIALLRSKRGIKS